MFEGFKFWPYGLSIFAGLIAGIGLTRDLSQANREARLAMFDLLWITSATTIAFLFTFSNIGKHFLDSWAETTNFQEKAVLQTFADSVTKPIAPSFCPTSEEEVKKLLGNRHTDGLKDRVCNWATKIDESVAAIKDSKTEIKAHCEETPLHFELRRDIFVHDENFCGSVLQTHGACGQAYCNLQRSTRQLRGALGDIPSAIDATNPILTEVFSGQRQLDAIQQGRQAAYHSSIEISDWDYLGYLLPLCFLFGLRLTKAFSDYFYKAVNASGFPDKQLAAGMIFSYFYNKPIEMILQEMRNPSSPIRFIDLAWVCHNYFGKPSKIKWGFRSYQIKDLKSIEVSIQADKSKATINDVQKVLLLIEKIKVVIREN